MKITHIEKVHVGRWIETAQCSIEINRRGIKGGRESLRWNHLHNIAGHHVVFNFIHALFEFLLTKAGDKVFFRDSIAAHIHWRQFRDRLGHLLFQLVESGFGFLQ